MQFLSISQRRQGFAEEMYAGLAEQEMDRARELYAAGWIRQIWHRVDTPGACLLWEAGSADEIHALWNTFPFAKAGMTEMTLVPLKPYGGFRPRQVGTG
ncbi:MAG: muconolactone Delta-isomerase family protein [Acidobacteriaceae bacterium]